MTRKSTTMRLDAAHIDYAEAEAKRRGVPVPEVYRELIAEAISHRTTSSAPAQRTHASSSQPPPRPQQAASRGNGWRGFGRMRSPK